NNEKKQINKKTPIQSGISLGDIYEEIGNICGRYDFVRNYLISAKGSKKVEDEQKEGKEDELKKKQEDEKKTMEQIQRQIMIEQRESGLFGETSYAVPKRIQNDQDKQKKDEDKEANEDEDIDIQQDDSIEEDENENKNQEDRSPWQQNNLSSQILRNQNLSVVGRFVSDGQYVLHIVTLIQIGEEVEGKNKQDLNKQNPVFALVRKCKNQVQDEKKSKQRFVICQDCITNGVSGRNHEQWHKVILCDGIPEKQITVEQLSQKQCAFSNGRTLCFLRKTDNTSDELIQFSLNEQVEDEQSLIKQWKKNKSNENVQQQGVLQDSQDDDETGSDSEDDVFNVKKKHDIDLKEIESSINNNSNQSFCQTCQFILHSFNRISSIKQNQKKNRNNNQFILLVLIIFCLSYNFFDVSGDQYYVGLGGDDSKSCSLNDHCLTLDASTLRGTVDSSTDYKVYVMNYTTISSIFTISTTLKSPRTFTNNPQNSTTQSEIEIKSGGQFSITGNTQFDHINFTMQDGKTNINGGVINALLSGASRTLEIINCKFIGCKASENGGAIYLNISNSAQSVLRNLSFNECQSNYGGAVFITIASGGKLTISGQCSFTECKALSSAGNGAGGGIYALVNSENSQLIFEDSITFERCCARSGGGMSMIIYNVGQLTITGSCLFKDCNSTDLREGGGLQILSSGSGSKINITGQLEFKNCFAKNWGGGLNVDINSNANIEINNATFTNCSCEQSGGGLLANIQSGGQLILDKSCEFYQCESHMNGGGIYIWMNFALCSFIIKNAYFHDCKSLNSLNITLNYSQSGFGGGIFLSGYGEYDPTSKLIDLHGMQIYNNTADKFGQSLFVVMAQVVELCQYGILGEYVKGNYSDTYSDENQLYGISLNSNEFYSGTYEENEPYIKPLILWWLFGILKSASVTVNVSNPNGKLMFDIEGSRMVPGYLNVKIFELRDKTQEEIDQKQKEINYKQNKNKIKLLKRTQSQSPISPKHKNNNQQQISISSNPKIKQKLLLDQANEIIYPPEDGSSISISIEGKIDEDQIATFGIEDGSQLNYTYKVYGVLISNDRNIFTGKDGKTLEEDENAAVQLDVIFKDYEKEQDDDQEEESQDEHDEKEGKGFPIGAIIGIAVGGLAIVAMIVVIIIVAVFISKKNKANKPASSYGPDMRARNLPMEIQYPQNSHALDAMNKAMEDNKW
ncbi:MAG: hypothetical protein EZS28_024268, partial [Streblomastix strix]